MVIAKFLGIVSLTILILTVILWCNSMKLTSHLNSVSVNILQGVRLLTAAGEGNVEDVRSLLENGCDVDYKDPDKVRFQLMMYLFSQH